MGKAQNLNLFWHLTCLDGVWSLGEQTEHRGRTMYYSLCVDCPWKRGSEVVNSNCFSTKTPNTPLGMLSLLVKVHHLPEKVSSKDNSKCQGRRQHFHASWSLATQTGIVGHAFPPVTTLAHRKAAHEKHSLQSGSSRPIIPWSPWGTQTTVEAPQHRRSYRPGRPEWQQTASPAAWAPRPRSPQRAQRHLELGQQVCKSRILRYIFSHPELNNLKKLPMALWPAYLVTLPAYLITCLPAYLITSLTCLPGYLTCLPYYLLTLLLLWYFWSIKVDLALRSNKPQWLSYRSCNMSKEYHGNYSIMKIRETFPTFMDSAC